jgi:hypothetical protein
MRRIRLSTLLVALIGATALGATTQAWAQEKYTIPRMSEGPNEYVDEHAIDVGDQPGHQVRIYQIRMEYPKRDLVFGGVVVKERIMTDFTDFINQSGAFIGYSVYTLEDGNKVFSRFTGTTQSDGSGGRKFVFVENFTGGTGKFKGMRGQLHGSGERAPGAKSLTAETSGEYWIEQ